MLNRTAARKGFTLIELIVTIVILGILAALAIPSFSAVIDRSRVSSVEETANSAFRNVSALAAFDEASPQVHEYWVTAAGELNGHEIFGADANAASAEATFTATTDAGLTDGQYWVVVKTADAAATVGEYCAVVDAPTSTGATAGVSGGKLVAGTTLATDWLCQ